LQAGCGYAENRALAGTFSWSTVLFGASGGAKFDAEARVRTPDDVARLLDFVVAYHESEIAWNADLAAYLKTSTDGGHIAHPAINSASPVKADAAGLERAPSLYFSSFFHWCLRRQLASTCSRGLAMAFDI
jgi:hypothetical protein